MNKTPIDVMLDNVNYIPVNTENNNDDGLPYVTHEGILNIADLSITVYVLNNGQRIIPREEMERIFGSDIINSFLNGKK